MGTQNILVVDDSASSRKLLRVVLEAEGYTVLEAEDGLQALGLLRTRRVDAIISDILMPGMDGYALCREIRGSKRFCNLPFIFYSGTYIEAGDEKLAAELGADKFLKKPASIHELKSALREATD